MTLLQQAGAAVLVVLITLSLQCGGAAALILWIRSIPREGPIGKLSALLVLEARATDR
jgi:hypothetical protein